MVNTDTRNTKWKRRKSVKDRTSRHSHELFRFIISLTQKFWQSDINTNRPWAFAQCAKASFAQCDADQGEAFLPRRNISLNNINSYSILSLNLLFNQSCKTFCLSQLLIAARYLLLDRSVHQLDTPASMLVIWVIVLLLLHTEQICVIVWWIWDTAFVSPGDLTSYNSLVKVRRLMLCTGDCIPPLHEERWSSDSLNQIFIIQHHPIILFNSTRLRFNIHTFYLANVWNFDL